MFQKQRNKTVNKQYNHKSSRNKDISKKKVPNEFFSINKCGKE